MSERRDSAAQAPSPVVTLGMLVPLVLVDSLHFVFARLLLPHVEPVLSACLVLLIATGELSLYGLATGRIRLEPLRRHWRLFLAIGFCIGVSTALNYTAVRYIDPGTASMLGKTSILFSLGLGIFWLGDRFERLQAVGAVIALAGLALVTFQPGDYLRLGSLLVLTSTFLYALHAALTKRFRGELDLLNFFFYRLLATSFFLILLALASRPQAWPALDAWPLLVLAATVDVIISRGLYYAVLQRLDMSVFAVGLTLSPVAAVLWSWLLFRVWPTGPQLLGGLAILAGVALVSAAPSLTRRAHRMRRPTPEVRL